MLTEPKAFLASLAALKEFALHEALRAEGVADPAAYLEEHDVRHVVTWFAELGLVVTLAQSTPKPRPAKGAPSSAP